MHKQPLAALAIAVLLGATPAGAAGNMDQMQAVHAKMDQQMQAGMQSASTEDERFVRMMIPHHQGAVEMSRLSLGEIKDPELRRMAEKTIQENEQGIQDMQVWLQQHARQ